MEFLGFVFGSKETLRKIEESFNLYQLPFPQETQVLKIDEDPPEGTHRGVYQGAIDFLIPLGTPVLAPGDGVIVAVVDSHSKFGRSPKYRKFLNYVTIKHGNGEYSQVAHLKEGSVRVNVGDKVTIGQVISETGNSGQMSEPHLHFLVFRSAANKFGFEGLKARFSPASNL